MNKMTENQKTKLRKFIAGRDDIQVADYVRWGDSHNPEMYKFLKGLMGHKDQLVVSIDGELYSIVKKSSYSAGPYYTPPHIDVNKTKVEEV